MLGSKYLPSMRHQNLTWIITCGRWANTSLFAPFVPFLENLSLMGTGSPCSVLILNVSTCLAWVAPSSSSPMLERDILQHYRCQTEQYISVCVAHALPDNLAWNINEELLQAGKWPQALHTGLLKRRLDMHSSLHEGTHNTVLNTTTTLHRCRKILPCLLQNQNSLPQPDFVLTKLKVHREFRYMHYISLHHFS